MKVSLLSGAVSLALVSTTAIVASVAAIGNADCRNDECEAPAPYVLKIITHGEGAPRAANNTPEGLQQNRRGDVAIRTRKMLQQVKALAPAVAAARPSTDSVIFRLTQNPMVLDQVLTLKVPATANIENGVLDNPIKLSMQTNYSDFIERWELRILPEGSPFDGKPLHVIEGALEGAVTEVEWNGVVSDGLVPKLGGEYSIYLRVFDRKGNFDQTAAGTVKFVTNEFIKNGEASVASENTVALQTSSVNSLSAAKSDEFTQQSISVSGSTVTVRGQGLDGVKSVEINGAKVRVNSDTNFAADYILSPGRHVFNINVQKKSGEVVSQVQTVDVKADYLFMVGIADVTIGENKVSGSIEPFAVDEHHYGGELFVDGRLAFYLKGKVRGKYLLTAQLDTGHEGVEDLFDNFHRKETDVFKRIDPDQYYLVYGDDSKITDDTQSQGKMYLRVDWDKSHAVWGNFKTAFSETELASFNRSLYGAQYRSESMATTTQGDRKTELNAFMSEATTVFRHNEFTGTGGSLYYLRDQDVVHGSEKLWVEVRRSNSEQVVERIPLERGRDYEIDEFQGRVILSRPLLNVSSQIGPSIIRDEPQLGDNTFLIVEYEYVPSEFVSGDAANGIRAKRWLNNRVAVGGTWVHESRDSEDYDVKGVDLTYKMTDDTYLQLEAAKSKASPTSGSFLSADGGLSFVAFNSNSEFSSGTAVGVELRVAASDVTNIQQPVTLGAWVKRREAGFSSASLDTGANTLDAGVEVVAELNDRLSLSGKVIRLHKKAESRESILAVQADYKATEKMTISGELRRVNDEVFQTNVSGNSNNSVASSSRESATLAAAKVALQMSDSVSVYGIAQGAVSHSGNYDKNSLIALGANVKASDTLSMNGEISSGDRGVNLTLGAEKKVGDTYSMYGNIGLLNDTDNQFEHSVTIGQRKTLSDKLKVYSEHQFSGEGERVSGTNTVGLSNSFNRYTTATLSFQASRVKDDQNFISDKNTLSAGLSFKRKSSQLSSKLEYTQDDSETASADQWVMTNHLEYLRSNSTRWQARLNLSSTEDNDSGDDDAKFVEAGVGFAYRPVAHDKLNMLGRWTYLHDLPPLSQSDKSARRSSIYSIESMYELGRRRTIGGKLARRKGELQTQRQGSDWIENDATLKAIRFRYKADFGVDALASYRWLKSDATQGEAEGALLSLGYNVGQNLQFAVGYNFTSFDDNLENEDYDVSGWFLNLVGKY